MTLVGAVVIPRRELELVVDAGSLSDASFRALSDAICDGTLEPGETLRIDELQSWLGVSRTPIREALARLARLGLVSTQPGRFTRVSLPHPDLHKQTIAVLGYQGAELVRQAVARFTNGELDLAVALVDELAHASQSDESAKWRSSLRRLLEHIWSASADTVTTQVLGDLALIVDANLRQAMVVPTPGAAAQDLYQHLRLALLERNTQAAARAFQHLYAAAPANEDTHSERTRAK